MMNARDDYPSAAAAERHPSVSAEVRAELAAMLDEIDRRRAWLDRIPTDVAFDILDGLDP